jgi:hypothetical protein
MVLHNMFCHAAGLCILLGLQGCTPSLRHNEGAVQIAQVESKPALATSIFISALSGDSRTIDKGEAVSVKLVSAYICDFREGKASGDWFSRSNSEATPCDAGDGNAWFLGTARSTSGEIAILANAGERTSTSTNGLSFNPATLQRNGRVVYYNEDVRESGQLINALNIPIYGPKTYEGGTFYLDLAMMELDNDENEQSRQLIQQLAQIGGAAFAPASPVLNVLNSLGGALLEANGDDVELRYQLEFDPSYKGFTSKGSTQPKASAVTRAPLREGYYAVVRMEQRDQLPKFNDMKIIGQPYSPLLADDQDHLYKGGSWLLIRVAREDNAQARTQDLTSTLADLLDPAAKTDATRIAELQAMVDALKGVSKPAPVKKPGK